MREVCEALFCGGSSGKNMEDLLNRGGGAGETRRLNIIYFLSRDGHIEHPHLIRVHHFYRNGVHLYDVKRWLAELRGKEMPGIYSWSYKRRYKSGYVWQDLMDEDLITPMCENEYVLKGSLRQNKGMNEGDEKEIHKTTPLVSSSSSTTSTTPPIKPSQEMLELEEDEMVLPVVPPAEMEQESPNGGASTEEETAEKKSGVVRVECGSRGEEPFLGKSGSGRRILRSLLSCREVETDATMQKPTHRRYPENRSWDHGKSWTGYSGRGGEKVVPTSYKPMADPFCSQCGKTFKPEKLHSHMKSCKAFKAHRKSTSNIEKLSLRTQQHTEEFSRETPPSFF